GFSLQSNRISVSAANEGFLRVKRQLLDGGVEVTANLARIFVRIDLEVAEMAPLPAKRNVEVNSQRGCWSRRALQGGMGFTHVIPSPERVRRIVRYEIVADRGLFLQTHVLRT